MMLFTATIGVEANPGIRIRDVVGPKVPLETVSILGKAMIEAVVWHLVKNVPNVEENHFKSVCKWFK